MTDNEINRAIAEYLGWTHLEEYEGILYGIRPGDTQPTDKFQIKFCNDVNAMQEALSKLDPHLWTEFCERLCALIHDCEPHDRLLFAVPLLIAKPRLWAEAFVKAISRWKS